MSIYGLGWGSKEEFNFGFINKDTATLQMYLDLETNAVQIVHNDPASNLRPEHGDSGGPIIACIGNECKLLGVISRGYDTILEVAPYFHAQ